MTTVYLSKALNNGRVIADIKLLWWGFYYNNILYSTQVTTECLEHWKEVDQAFGFVLIQAKQYLMNKVFGILNVKTLPGQIQPTNRNTYANH